ncbi:uncharacterized protein P174DRAFT_464931 [Aspergillus novofumigatus IBT 16806]|uniref:Uncharacterized protein n=1 Tax=Aspergillus novofumigatus (strain IBT 16806) TaxID=1392255 RepID=A0A2I1BTS4_ASPN1|nr:uncharacterized protein P174DRAFT_464931 [Aspergillus novofumigatus IBT 16806]PKX88742.1 hypothetical protein P174DRAFT_464931 [Aspergillus novofumigatus IBT 16806]
MTVLAFSNKIILASSMKRDGTSTYEFGGGNNPVARALQLCQAAEQNTRVAMIVYKTRAPPCGTGATGCNLFVEQVKMRVVHLNIGKTPNKPYDLSTLAGETRR